MSWSFCSRGCGCLASITLPVSRSRAIRDIRRDHFLRWAPAVPAVTQGFRDGGRTATCDPGSAGAIAFPVLYAVFSTSEAKNFQYFCTGILTFSRDLGVVDKRPRSLES